MAKQSTQAKTEERDRENPPLCTLPIVRSRVLPEDIPMFRARLIRVNEKKWVNGTIIHYYFFHQPTDGDNGSWTANAEQQGVVRRTFQEWKDLGLGLEFREVANREDAEVRIGFLIGDGSWSYVGRDVIDLVPDPNERTMNFGWNLTTDFGWDTALHEIGHTLGFPHEHQNPNSGIVWNEDAVYQYFRGPPNNWRDTTIEWNILRKLAASEVTGSDWDPDSIMHYSFPAGLIQQPPDYAVGLEPEPGLSETDAGEARQFYPGFEDEDELLELHPYESQRLTIQPSEQVNLRIRPKYTRRYTIQTFGRSDTVIVLFDNNGEEPRYIAGDDDSGYDRNAQITVRLYRGSEYVLRVRLYYTFIAGDTAVFMY